MEHDDLEAYLKEVKNRERIAKRRAIIYTIIPMFAGVVLLCSSVYLLNKAQKNLDIKKAQANSYKEQVEYFQKLRDSVRIEYLQAKGFDFSNKKELLNESIKADDLLTQLVKKGTIDRNAKINYYRKSLDQEKIWLSIKELGYVNIKDDSSKNPILSGNETNSIVFGSKVNLYDVKILALVLIRAGFKVQHILPSTRNKEQSNLIQIVRVAPSDGSPDNSTSFTAEQIFKATSFETITTN